MSRLGVSPTCAAQREYASTLVMAQTAVEAKPIRVLRASAEVAARLSAAPSDAGCVHSVFEHALNLHWHDGRLLTLHGPGALRAPFAAALGRLPRSPNLRHGLPVLRRDDGIAIGDTVLELRGAVTIDTAMPKASIGPHPALVLVPIPPTARGLDSAMARGARARLADGISRRDPAAFIEGALRLIGLGEGLTPAGDDCLVGALAALYRFAPSWLGAQPEIAARVEEVAGVGTTSVAREFVSHALAGHFAESLIDLLAATSADGVAVAVRRLLASGATSGADTLSGVHLALAALDRQAS